MRAVFLAVLFACSTSARPHPLDPDLSDSDSVERPNIAASAPRLDSRQSKTNTSGTVVNLTATPPFMAPAFNGTVNGTTSIAHNTSVVTKTLQQEVADGGGAFTHPNATESWTTVEHNVLQWKPVNHLLDVWLHNDNPSLLSEDVWLATVPPGTFSLTTSVPKSVKTGVNYTLYLTPMGNQSWPISTSDHFAMRSYARTSLGGVPSLGPSVAGVVGCVAVVLAAVC